MEEGCGCAIDELLLNHTNLAFPQFIVIEEPKWKIISYNLNSAKDFTAFTDEEPELEIPGVYSTEFGEDPLMIVGDNNESFTEEKSQDEDEDDFPFQDIEILFTDDYEEDTGIPFNHLKKIAEDIDFQSRNLLINDKYAVKNEPENKTKRISNIMEKEKFNVHIDEQDKEIKKSFKAVTKSIEINNSIEEDEIIDVEEIIEEENLVENDYESDDELKKERFLIRNGTSVTNYGLRSEVPYIKRYTPTEELHFPKKRSRLEIVERNGKIKIEQVEVLEKFNNYNNEESRKIIQDRHNEQERVRRLEIACRFNMLFNSLPIEKRAPKMSKVRILSEARQHIRELKARSKFLQGTVRLLSNRKKKLKARIQKLIKYMAMG